MTLVLKSKNTAIASVGNVHGNKGPSNFAAMLDFARGEYYTMLAGQRTDYALSEAVLCSRASNALFCDENGTWNTAPPNTPRRHFMRDLGVYGLLVEIGTSNRLTTATSGPVVIPAAAEGINFSYEGAGEAALASASLTLSSTIVAGGRTFKRYTRSTNAQFTADFTATGAVTNPQVEVNHGPSSVLALNTVRAQESIRLGSAFTSAIADGTASIVIRALMNPGVRTHTVPPGCASFGIPAALHGGAFLTEGAVYIGANGAAFNTHTRLVTHSSSYGRSLVAGMAVVGFGAQASLFSMGLLTKSAGTSALLFGAPSEITIGSAFAGVPSRAIDGIITHCVIYPSIPTDQEMLTLANQWVL